MTLLLQDEKGAFNFDQETVINPETGEQVTVAWVELQGTGRGAQVEWQPPLKPASWAPPPRSRAGTGAGRPGTASSAPSPPATKSAERRAWASISASTPECWSMSRSPGWGVGVLLCGWGVLAGRARPRPPLTLLRHLFPRSPRIFGFEGADAEDVVYVNWLNMVRAGLLALEFYTPEASSWRQVGAGGPLRREGSVLGTKTRILGVGMGQLYLRGT